MQKQRQWEKKVQLEEKRAFRTWWWNSLPLPSRWCLCVHINSSSLETVKGTCPIYLSLWQTHHLSWQLGDEHPLVCMCVEFVISKSWHGHRGGALKQKRKQKNLFVLFSFELNGGQNFNSLAAIAAAVVVVVAAAAAAVLLIHAIPWNSNEGKEGKLKGVEIQRLFYKGNCLDQIRNLRAI